MTWTSMHWTSWSVRRVALVAGALTAAFALMACESSDGEGSASPEPTRTAVTGAGGGDAASNVDMASCTPIEVLVRASFPGVTPMLDATAFEADGEMSAGCRVLIVGTADELPNFIDVAGKLRTALEGDGWEATDSIADGPAATQILYTKGDQKALIAAGVSPKDPGACPSDQLIGDCLDSLEADEILVQGSIIVVVK